MIRRSGPGRITVVAAKASSPSQPPVRQTIKHGKGRRGPNLLTVLGSMALIFIIATVTCIYLITQSLKFNPTTSTAVAVEIHDQNPPRKSHDNLLPRWIEDYIEWHQQMRSAFPGKSIITDPNAPPVLVRICLGLCGGLHDRLGQLPLDLYMANQTQRVLLIKWIKPQPLQQFLVPPEHGIDWVFPDGVQGWGTNCKSLNACAKQVRAKPNFSNVGGKREELKDVPFGTLVDGYIHDLNHGKYKDEKAVTFTIMGHLSEDHLERKLKELGETDMIHATPSFGNIFRRFFRPHPNVMKEIDDVNRVLGLIPGEYSIAHCRVRHPKAYPPGEMFNGDFISNADKTGLPFEGRFQELSLGIASKSIKCAMTLPDVQKHPLYFMSDSSDLVTYLSKDLRDETYVQQHQEWFDDENGINSTSLQMMTRYKVVARDQNFPNAHIDKNKGRPAEAYYATFVDLYLGMNARCISFGIGNFAVFAGKLSGTSCTVRYMKELWGGYDRGFQLSAKSCELPEQKV